MSDSKAQERGRSSRSIALRRMTPKQARTVELALTLVMHDFTLKREFLFSVMTEFPEDYHSQARHKALRHIRQLRQRLEIANALES
jgi:hypothetical protein